MRVDQELASLLPVDLSQCYNFRCVGNAGVI